MPRKLAISQILENTAALKTNKEKVEYLRQNDNSALRMVLQYAMDNRVKWLLPEGAPPYKPNNNLDQEGMLYSEARRLYLFIEGGNPNLTKLKREMLFIDLIQSVHPKDAELLISIKEKKLPYKGITKKLVNEAFPGLVYE